VHIVYLFSYSLLCSSSGLIYRYFFLLNEYRPTHTGHLNSLSFSQDYGRNPDYLEKRKLDTYKARDEYDSYVAEHFRKGAMRKLSQEEREQLLAGLKKNWEQVQHDFLMLSVIVDTPGKMTYKEKMELELKQLEKDVELIETHKTVYIANWL